MAGEYRVTWSGVEPYHAGDGWAWPSFWGLEPYHVGAASLRATFAALEPFHAGAAMARLTAAPLEPFHAGAANVRTTETFLEVWRSIRDTPWPVFPVRLFCPPSLKIGLTGAAESGGSDPGGEAALGETPGLGGRWVAEFAEAPLWSREKLLAWRRFVAAADNGVMPVVVPIWDRRHQPFADPKLTAEIEFGKDVWDDIWTWSEDQCHARFAAEAAQYATRIRFTYAGAARPEGGEHFSLLCGRYAWRLYRLIRILSDDGTEIVADIRPPLREFARLNLAMNFDSPRCSMRADGDIEAMVEQLRFGKGAARFVESFARYP